LKKRFPSKCSGNGGAPLARRTNLYLLTVPDLRSGTGLLACLAAPPESRHNLPMTRRSPARFAYACTHTLHRTQVRKPA
jgi:hypothetical protein